MRHGGLVLAVIAATGVDAQNFFSSFSSTSYTRGPRGNLHKETKTVTHESSETGDIRINQDTKVNCMDGDCQGEKIVSVMPSSFNPSAMFGTGHPCLRGVKNLVDLLLPKDGTEMLMEPQPTVPTPIHAMFGEPVPIARPIVPIKIRVDPPVNMGFLDRRPMEVPHKRTPVNYGAAMPPKSEFTISDFAMLATASLMVGLFTLTILSVLKRCCCKSVQARDMEVSDRPLFGPGAGRGEMAQPLTEAGAPVGNALAPLKVAAVAATVPEKGERADITFFQFKPSVGTWLSPRMDGAEEV